VVCGCLRQRRLFRFASSLTFSFDPHASRGDPGGPDAVLSRRPRANDDNASGVADAQDWNVAAVLNNDMIGNIQGQDGVADNAIFRVFSEPVPTTNAEEAIQRARCPSGEPAWRVAYSTAP
jgi:hypothetical protein